MHSKTLRKDTAFLFDKVIKTNPRSPRLSEPTSNGDFTIVPGSFFITATTLKHGEKYTLHLKFAVGNSEFTEIFRAKMLEPDVVDGMMYNSHLIGFGVANTDGCG